MSRNMLAYGDETFDNRIAVGPTNRNNDSGNCFKFRTAGNYKGLWSQYADRNISILNLKKGEQVTFTISNGDATLKFVGGDAVVSGQTYTIEADGNLDFVTTGGVYIEKVAIEDPVASQRDDRHQYSRGEHSERGQCLVHPAGRARGRSH